MHIATTPSVLMITSDIMHPDCMRDLMRNQPTRHDHATDSHRWIRSTCTSCSCGGCCCGEWVRPAGCVERRSSRAR